METEEWGNKTIILDRRETKNIYAQKKTQEEGNQLIFLIDRMACLHTTDIHRVVCLI